MTIEQRMEQRKAQLIREYRSKLPSMHAAQKLMDFGELNDDDCQVLADKLGSGKATHILNCLGYEVDYQPGDHGNGPVGSR